MKASKVLFALCAGAISLNIASVSQAQNMFNKPISLVVPFAPGGSTDPVARIIAPLLGEELGQPVLVRNQPGAGGALGAAQVSRADADGHTILLSTGVVAVHPHTLKSPGYDVLKDLTPVTQLATGSYTVIVNPKLPVKTIQELVAYGKANPGKLFYGTSGVGGSLHLITELFSERAGLKMDHIPYKGNGPVVTALLAGDIQVAFDTIPGSKALGDDGRVRILAITSAKRSPMMPNIPTVDESGYPGFAADMWTGIFAPAGTNPAVVQRYNEALKKVLQNTVVQERLGAIGYSVVGNSPDQFRKIIKDEIEQWKEIAALAKIEKM